MIIIGCDPGKSFGVAVFYVPTQQLYPFQGPPDVALVFIQKIIASYLATQKTIGQQPNIIFAIERFIVTPGAGRRTGASDTSPLVGSVTQIAEECPDATVALQTSADAARGFPTALLRRLGLYVTPMEVGQSDANDANSALRHVLLWIMRNRADLMEALMKDVPLV